MDHKEAMQIDLRFGMELKEISPIVKNLTSTQAIPFALFSMAILVRASNSPLLKSAPSLTQIAFTTPPFFMACKDLEVRIFYYWADFF